MRAALLIEFEFESPALGDRIQQVVQCVSDYGFVTNVTMWAGDTSVDGLTARLAVDE